MVAQLRRAAPGVPALIAALVALALALQGRDHGATVVAAALIVVAGLLLEVDLPWGGRVPLGYAVHIAVAVLLAPIDTLVVTGLVLVVTAALRPRVQELLGIAAAGAAAVAAAFVFGAVAGDASKDVEILLEVVVVGGAFLAVDLLLARRRLDQVAPLYVTLLCAAALLAVAYEHRAALALVAAVPLLVTRYSFGRFTRARQTYAQTTQALSLLPEVAGLTPLGHGERTAVYAAALADELGFDGAEIDRIATAARLHHIGHISLHEPEERQGPIDAAELGRVSAELLRETGFLSNVAELVEQVQVDGAASLEVAVIRVASTLDDLIGEDETAGDPFSALLLHHRTGLERTAAIALLRLHDERPDIVEEARAASRMLALVAGAAAAHGHDPHHPDAHDCR